MVGTSELMGVAEGAHFLHSLSNQILLPHKYIIRQPKSREGRLIISRESLLTTEEMYE